MLTSKQIYISIDENAVEIKKWMNQKNYVDFIFNEWF